jgi:hypothetical protein
MKPHHGATALFAVLAASVSLATGWWGSHTVLAAVPTMLLLRYVFADFEGTLTAALIGTAAIALIGLVHSDAHAIVVAVGGFVAAELATVGTIVRRRESTAVLKVLWADAAINCGLAIAAAAGTAAVALLHPPTWLALTALIVLALAVIALAVRSLIERGTPG